jgi:hypothetical protein
MYFLKRLLYKTVKQDSRNMGDLGNKLGWDWLEQEGKQNVENPSRALRKSAITAASMYAGGLLGGATGGAAGATEVAASEAAKQAAQVAAQEAAKQAAAEAAKQSVGGLLSQASTQVTANAVPGLLSTGPTSQAAMLAQQNAGLGFSGLARTADSAATAQGLSPYEQFAGNAMGYMDKAGGMLGRYGKTAGKMNQVMGLLSPQENPPPMAPPPQQQMQQEAPSFAGYGGGPGDMQKMLDDPNLPPELRQKLMMMMRGYQ